MSFRSQSRQTSTPVNPVTRRRSVSDVTARRGMLDAMRPNRSPSAVLASGDRNANGCVPV